MCMWECILICSTSGGTACSAHDHLLPSQNCVPSGMDEDQKRLSRLQKTVAYDVIINNYDYLVGCVNAVRIFPYLVSSRLVEPDFRQFLDNERTDKEKMMALLQELTRNPEGTWFDRFTNALSKLPHYETVADVLLRGKVT